MSRNLVPHTILINTDTDIEPTPVQVMEIDTELGWSADAGTSSTVPEGAIITLRPAEYLLDGEPYVPETVDRYFTDANGGILADASEVLTYTVQPGDTVISAVEIPYNPEVGGLDETLVSQIPQITVTATPGTDVPPTPIASDWSVSAGEFVPEGQVVTSQPVLTISAALGVVAAQWTTSQHTPAIESHWETLVPTGTLNQYLTEMLNQGTGDWHLFEDNGSARNGRLRFRYKTNLEGPWSLESDAKSVVFPALPGAPDAPTGQSAVPAAADGQITITATNPNGSGELQWAAGGGGYQTFTSPATVDLGTSYFGKTITINFAVFDPSTGLRSTAVTDSVDVPGEPVTEDPGAWKRFFTCSVPAKNSYDNGNGPDLYRYGKSGMQLQYCVGYVRSPVNPNKAMGLMDVALGWVTENAEDDWPRYRHVEFEDVGNRYSIAAMFDPDDEDRFLYAISNQSNGNAGGGLYLSYNLGKKVKKVLSLSKAPGGSGNSYGGLYRCAREVITYDPNNRNRWWFFNATDGCYRSTDRCENWSPKLSLPSGIGQVGYALECSGLNGNHLWLGTDTGLWKSENSATSWDKKNPSGLPSGAVTCIRFNPNNWNEFFVVVYLQGLFKTTNGGTSFTRVTTPHNAVGSLYISPVDRDYMWLMGMKTDLNNDETNKVSLYTVNGGTSWGNCGDFSATYGWEIRAFLTKVRGMGKDTRDMQFQLSPSPTDKNRVVGTGMCRMVRTNNAKDFYNASDGYDNLGSGEANLNSTARSKSDPDVMVWMCFDYGPYISRDAGLSWSVPAIPGNGLSDNKGGLSCAIHPGDPDRMLLCRGGYHGSDCTLQVAENGLRTNGGTFKPSFMSGGIGKKQRWADWGTETDTNWAYCVSGISSDGGGSWQTWNDRAESGFPDEFHRPNEKASGVHGRSGADGRVLYAFNNAGTKIRRTGDRGKNWTEITGTTAGKHQGPGMSRNQPYSFFPDPHDANVCYWWKKNTGLIRYEHGSGFTVHATQWKSLSIGRIRVCEDPAFSDYMFMIASMGSNGGTFALRSLGGPDGPWVDVTNNLPRVGSNRTLEIDRESKAAFVWGTAGTRFLEHPDGHDESRHWAALFGV